MKIRGGVGKWALRQVLHRRLPVDLVDRPKMGFTVPIDRWLRGPLRQWAADLLSIDELRKSGLCNATSIAHAWHALQQGRREACVALWAVIMFQAWRTRWHS
jgi:asparagine synthase (glutamine-hydrolysing)